MFFFLRNDAVVILVKILLDAIFSGVQMKLALLHERSHCENVFENRFNITFGGYSDCLQVMQPFFCNLRIHFHSLTTFECVTCIMKIT